MISAINEGPNTAAAGDSAGISASRETGVNDFLKLLIAQLQHQDPLNPLDSREFTSQLAQFSALEEAIKTNRLLETLALYEASANNARALGLIGREVVAGGDTFHLSEGKGSYLSFTLDGPTAETRLRIYDSGNRLVREVELGPMESGYHVWEWNGRDGNGNLLPQGQYRFEVIGMDLYGEAVGVSLSIRGIVDAVRFEDGRTMLLVNGIPVALNEIIEVR
jgi:flagellar basal-body rod modification protein FlgD